MSYPIHSLLKQKSMTINAHPQYNIGLKNYGTSEKVPIVAPVPSVYIPDVIVQNSNHVKFNTKKTKVTKHNYKTLSDICN